MKNILIIEDNDNKYDDITNILNENFNNINIIRSKTICDSMNKIIHNEENIEFFDIILLDMNFPRYDDDLDDICRKAGLEILENIFIIENLEIYNDKIIVTSSENVEELLIKKCFSNVKSLICDDCSDYSKELLNLTQPLL